MSIKSKPNEVTDQGIFEQRLRSVEKPLTFAKFLRQILRDVQDP